MARQVIVLALIFIALVGVVSAATETANATATATANATDKAPATDKAAETPTAEAADAEAPSVGANGETIGEEANAPTGELGPATAEALGPSGDKKSNAGALKVSVAMAGVAAVVGFFSF